LREEHQLLRQAAENDLETFINLVSPHRVLGNVHKELFRFWERSEAKSHQLVLLPRDHQKSAMIAYRVAWYITRDPTLRVLYISSTARLAEKQLKFIQDIFTSDIYRLFWPEMVSTDDGKREKWTQYEIAVDHPKRKQEGVRDPTIFTGGLTTSLTGLHCDIAVLDDVVVQENAYSVDGRKKVEEQYSLLASIEGAEAREWAVGTRYHARDLYSRLEEMEEEIYNKAGEITGREPIYEVFQRQVEDRGDGTGNFIWSRQRRADGKWFGFDQQILSKKRGQYLDKRQFRAQYYNDPNAPGEGGIKPEYFQYFKREFLERRNGSWHIRGRRKLNVFAAVDFAYSTAARADYTSIVVVGMDSQHNYFVLDIDRFKTDKIKDYFDRISILYNKWQFRKIRAEVNVAQKAIVNSLKEYIKEYGIFLAIDEYRPTRHMGTKEERMDAVLRPRYENRQVYHFQGGSIQVLEEELVSDNPPHDDVKDALSQAIDIAKAPAREAEGTFQREEMNMMYNSKFGGIG
jgi:hypothetical protein